MRFTFLVFVPLLAISAQPFPDAITLLKQSSTALQRYSSYQYVDRMTMDVTVNGTPTMTATTSSVSVAGRDKFRVETTSQNLAALTMVADGNHTWTYMPLLKTYTKKVMGSSDIPGGMNLPDDPQVSANAKVLRAEVLDVDGQPHDCWVVESRVAKLAGQPGIEMQDAVYTLWIDKLLGIEFQMSMSGKMAGGPLPGPVEMRQTTTRQSLKLDEKLSDSLFTFTPPEGSKEVAELVPGMSTWMASSSEKPKEPVQGEPEAFVPNLNPVHRVEPKYPEAARSQGLQGMVHMLVTIDPAGRVVKVEPLTGRGALRQAAIDAVRQWEFRPVMRNGRSVSAYTDATVSFFIDSMKPPKNVDEMGINLTEEMTAAQRIAELTRRLPRTPDQTLADMEQDRGGVDGIERGYALPELAKAAAAAGALDKAQLYASELLRMGPSDANYGQAVHDGNMVLGIVALRQGNIGAAKHYLLESGKTPGSPVLDSFGPDFTLAKELLQKGERDAVLQYLSLCRAFWKMGADRLDSMSAAVRTGGRF